MTLDELKRTAPRSFDKTLLELLVAIQHGGRPIAAPPEMVREVVRVESLPDDIADALREMADQIVTLKRQVFELQHLLTALEAVELYRPRGAA